MPFVQRPLAAGMVVFTLLILGWGWIQRALDVVWRRVRSER